MIEPINESTYRLKMAEDEVEVGDINATEFKPHAKLKRWGEECYLCVKPAGDITEIEVELEGDKVKSKYKVKQNGFELELESEFYPLPPDVQNELGAFELNIILAKKPSTNKLIFDIETEGLKFYYQPELTPEEIAEGAIQPENVIGSYAVYHATKRDHIVGQTNYRVGKAFHIYRPRIEDADGKWVWGELLIVSGTLTVTIPQDFLDTAKYPICHATGATFGYTSVGSESEDIEDAIRATVATPAGSGTGVSITACLVSSVTEKKAKGTLYDNSGNLITNGPTEEHVVSTLDDWLVFNFLSPPTISVQEYWIAIWGETTGGSIEVRYDTAESGDGKYQVGVTYNGWPNPWTPGNSSRKKSIYCTYTPSDGANAMPMAMNHYRRMREA